MSQIDPAFHPTLKQLGWQPFFQQQLSLEEWENYTPARMVAQARSEMKVTTAAESLTLHTLPTMPTMTVGDWLLLDKDNHFVRMLDRSSLFTRKAAGSRKTTQLIAANIDTVFIVSSLNQDFNLNRIERYLTLANEAGVEPVLVLTKHDLCEDAAQFVTEAQTLDPLLNVIPVNSFDEHTVEQLEPWCREGKTIVFLGSSGVGKSTLVNRLLGTEKQKTGAMREDDAKGRHTTTGRSLHLLPTGGLLLDTPGIRELQLTTSEASVEETFTEITDLESLCRFSDCQHQSEPGCAILAALASGELDERRLANFQKLKKEQAFNAATLAEKRAKGRKLGRYYQSVQSENRKNKKE